MKFWDATVRFTGEEHDNGKSRYGNFQYKKILPKYSFEDILRTYGLIGRIPFYLNKWNCSLTVEENIKKEFITKGDFFLEELKKSAQR